MEFPATSDQLKAAGYMYDEDAECKECGVEIELWFDPRGHRVSLDVIPGTTAQHATDDLREPHGCD